MPPPTEGIPKEIDIPRKSPGTATAETIPTESATNYDGQTTSAENTSTTTNA